MAEQQYKQLPKCEFILNTIANTVENNDVIPLEKLNTILYLLDKEVLKKYNTTIGYDFDKFMFSGPYDEQLDSDINTWKYLEFIKYKDEQSYVSNLRINEDKEKGGVLYKTSVVDKILEKQFGGQNELENIRTMFKNYLKESDDALIEKAYDLWISEHQNQKEKFKNIFKFTKNDSDLENSISKTAV